MGLAYFEHFSMGIDHIHTIYLLFICVSFLVAFFSKYHVSNIFSIFPKYFFLLVSYIVIAFLNKPHNTNIFLQSVKYFLIEKK
jgi:hypothetical protein